MAAIISQQKIQASGTVVTDYFRPELICQVIDEDLGELGYVVIDRTVGTNPSGGGIRFAPGVTVTEIAQLARNMTLKFAFLNLPTGGAKAGITVSPPLDHEMRARVVTAFGKHLRTLLKRNVYFMGEDLGIDLNDLNLIQKTIGNAPYRFAEKKEDMGPTGLTVFESIKQCALSRGLKLCGATAVIEGLGRIGSEVALMLSGAGAKILAVSTAQGAIFDEKGLNVQRILEERKKYGDSFVTRSRDTRNIDLRDMLAIRTDILVPCARIWTINPGNARQVDAKIIVSGANGPVFPHSEKVLFERNILLMPDFVSSCGTILYSAMAARGFNDQTIKKFISTHFSDQIGLMLKMAVKKGISAPDYARSIAWRNFSRMDEMYSQKKPDHKKGCLVCKVRAKGPSGIWDKMKKELNQKIPSKAEQIRKNTYASFVSDTLNIID